MVVPTFQPNGICAVTFDYQTTTVSTKVDPHRSCRAHVALVAAMPASVPTILPRDLVRVTIAYVAVGVECVALCGLPLAIPLRRRDHCYTISIDARVGNDSKSSVVESVVHAVKHGCRSLRTSSRP